MAEKRRRLWGRTVIRNDSGRGANKNDPRRLTAKGLKKKAKFANAEERIEYKLEKVEFLTFFFNVCVEMLL